MSTRLSALEYTYLFVVIWSTECEITIVDLLQMKMGCVLVEEGVVAVVLVVQCLVEQEAVFLAFVEQEVYTGKRKSNNRECNGTSLE